MKQNVSGCFFSEHSVDREFDRLCLKFSKIHEFWGIF